MLKNTVLLAALALAVVTGFAAPAAERKAPLPSEDGPEVKVLSSSGVLTEFVRAIHQDRDGTVTRELSSFWAGERLIQLRGKCYVQTQQLVRWTSRPTPYGPLLMPELDVTFSEVACPAA